jgi:hypothetical protein
MKMEKTECSETSAYTFQTPGSYPEEIIHGSEHGERLKSKSPLPVCILSQINPVHALPPIPLEEPSTCSVFPLAQLTCAPPKSNLNLANSLALMNKSKTGIGVITNKWTLKTDLNEWNVEKNKPFNP